MTNPLTKEQLQAIIDGCDEPLIGGTKRMTSLLPAPTVKAMATLALQSLDREGVTNGWRPIATAEKDRTRRLLLWLPVPGMGEHIELGYWSEAKLSWVNTYGNSYGEAQPDMWAGTPALSPQPDTAKEVGTCHCQACNRPFYTDLLVPDDIWEAIKPEGKDVGCGLLCSSCVMDRAADLCGWTVGFVYPGRRGSEVTAGRAAKEVGETEAFPISLVDFIWQELCEEDRSSPEDQPDMALVCRNDLLVYAEKWNERQPAHPAPQSPPAPVADEGMVERLRTYLNGIAQISQDEARAALEAALGDRP